MEVACNREPLEKAVAAKFYKGDKMLPLIPLAMGLAEFAPKLVGWLAGDKAEDTAKKVVGIAKSLTGYDDPQQAINAVKADPELQLKFSQQINELEIEEIRGFTERFNKMVEADKVGNTTRPHIALMMAKTTCFAIIVSIGIWAYAVILNQTSMMNYLKECWPLLLAILGTPTALLRSYFALRSGEKKARYQMASEQEIAPSIFGNIVNLLKK